jgi:hypothetical protein
MAVLDFIVAVAGFKVVCACAPTMHNNSPQARIGFLMQVPLVSLLIVARDAPPADAPVADHTGRRGQDDAACTVTRITDAGQTATR